MVSREENAPLVAVIDGAPAIVALLEEALTEAGFRVVGMTFAAGRFSADELTAFLRDQAPRVVLLDIPPPYSATWPLLGAARFGAPDAAVTVITTDAHAVAELARNDGHVPVIGKPFELDEVLTAVRQGIAAASGKEAAIS